MADKQNKNEPSPPHSNQTGGDFSGLNETVWKIIEKYFEDNPQSLVRHHTDSYNDFYGTGIFQIFKEKNPIRINSVYDNNLQEYKHQCLMYFGGKDGTKIYFGKPVIYDTTGGGLEGKNENPHYMFPNEARLRNMNYSMTIHYDIDIEYYDYLENGDTPFLVGVGGSCVDEEKFGGDGDENGDEDDKYGVNVRGGENDDGEPPMEGGAKRNEKEGETPKPPQKGQAQRKRRVKSTEVYTTADIANLRENVKQSMVKPNQQRRIQTIEKVYLGKFPIMVQSKFCILNGCSRETIYNMGECKNDLGGYFIIDGKEKTVIPQEKFGDNIMYIRKSRDDEYLYTAEIKSVSENISKPIRTLSVRLVAPGKKFTNENIVVMIPNVRNPVPLFIVFRALGIINDKKIIETCLLDIEKYKDLLDVFIPSIHDAGGIMTQTAAIMYIASLTKYHTTAYALEILSDYFLPHIGELNFIQKANYLGYMVFRLISVYKGLEPPTDRDNYKYKRVELVGSLLNDLFREYYTLQQRTVHLDFEKRLYYNRDMYENNLFELIQNNYHDVFRERTVEIGFRKAFKGNWGASPHTKRIGIIQDLNRLSFNTMMSHLRKINLPMDSGVKLVEPRVLHCSQWGFMDPIDTPDGANIGIHKTMAIATVVSRGASREPMIKWLRKHVGLRWTEECSPPSLLASMTKVLVNGFWAGVVENPIKTVNKMLLYRRNALLPIYTSITFEIRQNTIYIYNDAGRLCRPIFYRERVDADEMEEGKGKGIKRLGFSNKFSVENKEIVEEIKKDNFTWMNLTTGFNPKNGINVYNETKIYEINELYGLAENTEPTMLERFNRRKAIIDYIDPGESENSLIALNLESTVFDGVGNVPIKPYTHLEIHESLMLGVMCNQIVFPEHNPPTRNAFSCGQSKQAVSLYHTNYQSRMDKTAVVLHYGQVPLVKSRYMNIINREENPYGENAIVAIMCYTGYNVEDAILINEGSLKRGLFNTTYYTVYETHEESTKNANTTSNKKFMNIENNPNVMGTKTGYDYSMLDKNGIILENTPVTDKTVLIGAAIEETGGVGGKLTDASKTPKKGQLGFVDKSFITEGEEGQRIAKVRLREVRIPNLGDKFAGRAGQKGTVGLIIPEEDFPFTKDGTRPDLIMNPHAIPSRMTIGQLVETVFGKASAMYGGFSDCTAFINKGNKVGMIGEHITKLGFHSSGSELLYNGMTGEQLESDIYIGPTYYMRLKHMVKDKINYRALGPRTALTHQPVSGRANDGGLRIGEMERDVLISHGITDFLRESMMERGDKYYMAVCNTTGMLAIYNPSKNLFMSPMADGPIRFSGSLATLEENKTQNINIENVTRYGRSFSVICVPYSFKLLIQELATINIQMRIITEDNIDQIENLSFSKNIEKLTQIPNVKISDVIFDMKQHFRNANDDKHKRGAKTLFSINEEEKEENEENDTAKYTEENNTDASLSPPLYMPPENEIERVQSNSSTGSNIPYAKDDSNDYTYNAKGGKHSHSTSPPPHHFEAGNKVYYPSPKLSEKVGGANLIWKIIKTGTHDKTLNNEPFYTIQTSQIGSLTAEDCIQVVSPNEIIPVVEYPHITPFSLGSPENGYIPSNFMQQPQMPIYGQMPPNMFPQSLPIGQQQQQPVEIKIFNGPGGSDNSVNNKPPCTTDYGTQYFNGGIPQMNENITASVIPSSVPYNYSPSHGTVVDTETTQNTPENELLKSNSFTVKKST